MTPQADKVNILVVDDLPEKLLVLETVLADLNENVISVRSGTEALQAVLRHDFAVILLDVNMPDIDGFETAALIRKRRKSAHVPIIFITSFTDEMHTAHGYSLGAVDYILSPVVPGILRTKVKVFVDLFRMTQQVRRQADERVALAEERSKRAAAEDASRRSNFKAEVSRALSDSLDPEDIAQTLVRHCVPFLADLAGVTLAGESGQPWRTELAWADPGEAKVHTRRLSAPEGPDDTLRAAVDRVLARGETEHLEGLDLEYPASDRVASDGAPRVRNAVVEPLRARGRTLGALTLTYGPSGRRHSREDLELAENLASRAAIALDNARLYSDVQRADRQKNEFLSMLAHELRNPLAPIRNAVQVLRLPTARADDLLWAREVIDRQVAQLVRLVDDLLDVSRITRGKIRLQMEPVDVARVVAHAVETSRPLIDERHHELTVSLPPEPVRVRGDDARLTQVVANLLNNAAKYTADRGRIWLAVRHEGGEVVVSVRDTGVGIPAEMLSTVFELFTQVDRSLDRSQGGLGVGLTLVRRLVEMHGGRVEAHSAGPNQGAEFVVRLPALTVAPEKAAAEDNGHSAITPIKSRILLVDDNEDAADSLALLLRIHGHEVHTAYEGHSALDLAAKVNPDIVLLDIGLPGISGYEVALELRRLYGTDPLLVAMTGYGQEEDRRRSREVGFDLHLVKPIDPLTLPALLSRPSQSPCPT